MTPKEQVELYGLLKKKWWQFWRRYAIVTFFSSGSVMYPSGRMGVVYHFFLGKAIRDFAWWDRNGVPHRFFAYNHLHHEWSEVRGWGKPFKTLTSPQVITRYAQHPDAKDWITR